jgi:enoyl-CoA hydratase/carnithine racemase
LVTRVVAHDALAESVRAWADELATRPPQALALIKAQLNASSERSLREALDNEALSQVVNRHHPDFIAALEAFTGGSAPST